MRAMSDPARAEPIVPRSGHGPGVLVLTAGALGDALARDALVRLAHHGFVAFAVDLPVPSGASRAQRAAGERSPSGDGPSDAERRAVDAGIEQLFRANAVDGSRVGVLAFGRGGLLALDAAARGARIAVVVALDAGFDPAALDGSLARVDAFVLAVFAGKGPSAVRGDAAELERRLRDEEIAAEVRTQPGAGEGFADPGQADRYDAAAARASWDAALARLRAELG
jgi:dienelactone hydrolase